MMKSFLVLMTLLAFVGCKDVEKNPSGCGYDMTNEDGLCVKMSYKGQKILNEVAKSSFINDYFKVVENTYQNTYVYDPILEKFLADLNGNTPISNLLLLIKKIDKNLEFVSFKASELKKIYDSSYSSGVYDQMSKLETLESDLRMMKKALEYTSNKDLLSYDFQHFDSERKQNYAKRYEDKIIEMKTKADMLQDNFGEFKAKVEYARNDGYNFKVSFSYSFINKSSQVVKDLENGLERHMLQDPTCQGDQLSVCIDEYYDSIMTDANTFYEALIK